MTNLNTRDTALLDILSSESNRQTILEALNHTCLKVNLSENDALVQFRETLAMTIRYVLSGDGLTVHDTVTGLTWQQAGSDKGYTDRGAAEYIETLNETSFGGFNDWRLPNDHELLSIVDRDYYNPAINPVFACKSAWYRTSKAYKSSSACAWCVDFLSGYVYHLNRDLSDAFVRAVRGASPAGQ